VSVARVQFGSSASATVTLGSPTTAGNLLVVLVSADGANSAVPSGITLGGSGAVFSNDASAASTNPIATITHSLWSLPNCPAGSTTVAPTFSGGSPAAILVMVWEVSGAALTSPLAAAPASAANPANTLQAAWDTGAAAAVPAGCWWVGGLTGVGSGGRATPVVSGAWTSEAQLQPGSATDMLGAYQAGPGSGSPEFAGTFSLPAAGAYWASVVAAYKPAGGGGTNITAQLAAALAPMGVAIGGGEIISGQLAAALAPMALNAHGLVRQNVTSHLAASLAPMAVQLRQAGAGGGTAGFNADAIRPGRLFPSVGRG
jgi:hypothetical protein